MDANALLPLLPGTHAIALLVGVLLGLGVKLGTARPADPLAGYGDPDDSYPTWPADGR